MAQVRLGWYEAEEGELPPWCMRCGRPATLYQHHQFSWMPDWIFLLVVIALWPVGVFSLLLRARMHVHMPLCERHRHYWLKRRLLSLAICAALAACAVIGIIVMAEAEDSSQARLELIFLLWGFGLAWLAIILVLRMSALRPVEIREDGISLKGVDQKFVLERDRERKLPSDERPTIKSKKGSELSASRNP